MVRRCPLFSFVSAGSVAVAALFVEMAVPTLPAQEGSVPAAAAGAGYAPLQMLRAEGVFTAIRTLEFGQDMAPFGRIRTTLQQASPAETKAVHLELQSVLRDGTASLCCRQMVCRLLAELGSPDDVPAPTPPFPRNLRWHFPQLHPATAI